MSWLIIFLFLFAIGMYLYTQYLQLIKQQKKEARATKLAEIEAFKNEEKTPAIAKLRSQHSVELSFITSATDAANQVVTVARNYIANMNQPNLYARHVTTQSELLNAYSSSFQEITPSEIVEVSKFLLELLNKIEQRNTSYYKYICNWINKIKIAKANVSLEGGMPHTLGNIIIMDGDWFQNPRGTTFLHELTHIHQREVPFEFEELYPKLGYESYDVTNMKGMEPILQLSRNNPDGISPNWIWRDKSNYWWIGALFQNATPSSLTEIDLIALKLDSDAQGNHYLLKQIPQSLNKLQGFNAFFGNNPNNYHPNEMSAKFAEWYLEDVLGDSAGRHYSSYEGYRIYKDFFNKLIGTFY